MLFGVVRVWTCQSNVRERGLDLTCHQWQAAAISSGFGFGSIDVALPQREFVGGPVLAPVNNCPADERCAGSVVEMGPAAALVVWLASCRTVVRGLCYKHPC